MRTMSRDDNRKTNSHLRDARDARKAAPAMPDARMPVGTERMDLC